MDSTEKVKYPGEEMVVKIISGGQTGVDRAALDADILLEIPHGGFVPAGRITEEGPRASKAPGIYGIALKFVSAVLQEPSHDG